MRRKWERTTQTEETADAPTRSGKRSGGKGRRCGLPSGRRAGSRKVPARRNLMGKTGRDKIELVDRVLKGEPVGRPPLSLWYHFGVQHGKGTQFARLALDYFRFYDFDFLKVMNDYFYPLPEGLDAVRTGADLRRIGRFDVERAPWREQFQALGVITENLISYSLRSIDIGSSGIFLSVPASREFMSREQFLTFVKPVAYRLLEAVFRRGRVNVAPFHGDDLYFDDCLDFPVHVFNWWDRGPGGPSLSAVKERISGCIMGGIDHKIVTRNTCSFLREHVREGKTLGGKDRFFLANGCSIDASVNPRAIRGIVEAAPLSGA